MVGKEQELRANADTASPPYNKRIELTARGRHALRLREGRAGFTLRPCPFQARASGPCSQLIRALYGRSFGPSKSRLGASAWKGRSPGSGYGIRGGRFPSLGRNEFLRGRLGACDVKHGGSFGVARIKCSGLPNGMFGRPGKEARIRAAREEAHLGLEKRRMKWASRGMDAC